jgi:hypothetical protein
VSLGVGFGIGRWFQARRLLGGLADPESNRRGSGDTLEFAFPERLFKGILRRN